MSSSIWDVVIGLAVVYFVFSTACTVITEWWARMRLARPRQLKKFIEDLIGHDQNAHDFAQRLLEHPLIDGLRTQRFRRRKGSNNRRCFPSYIPPRVFALAMLDLAFAPADEGSSAEGLLLEDRPCASKGLVLKPSVSSESVISGKGLPVGLHTLLHSLTNCTRGSCQHTQERIERWFTDSMGRLTGQYTRYAQSVSLGVAVLVTLVCNVDTVAVARTLSQNPARAQAAVTLATNWGQQNANVNSPQPQVPVSALSLLDLPLGWSNRTALTGDDLFMQCLGRLLGWTLTTFALSLGAPFWFDTLNRIMRLRQAGVKPDAT